MVIEEDGEAEVGPCGLCSQERLLTFEIEIRIALGGKKVESILPACEECGEAVVLYMVQTDRAIIG